jgi:hypothetical protein
VTPCEKSQRVSMTVNAGSVLGEDGFELLGHEVGINDVAGVV